MTHKNSGRAYTGKYIFENTIYNYLLKPERTIFILNDEKDLRIFEEALEESYQLENQLILSFEKEVLAYMFLAEDLQIVSDSLFDDVSNVGDVVYYEKLASREYSESSNKLNFSYKDLVCMIDSMNKDVDYNIYLFDNKDKKVDLRKTQYNTTFSKRISKCKNDSEIISNVSRYTILNKN